MISKDRSRILLLDKLNVTLYQGGKEECMFIFSLSLTCSFILYRIVEDSEVSF